MQNDGHITYYLSSGLDAQRRELVRILLLCDPRMKEAWGPEKAQYLITDTREMRELPNVLAGQKLIVLAPTDLWRELGGLHRNHNDYRQYIKQQNARIIYLLCETEPRVTYKTERKYVLYEGDDHFIKLSMPLGYFAGSKINMVFDSQDKSAFFVSNTRANPKDYEFNWAWIGSESTKDRRKMVNKLFRQYDSLYTNVVDDKARKFDLDPRLNGAKNILMVPKPIDVVAQELFDGAGGNDELQVWYRHLDKVHADNKIIPYDRCLALSRQTKVNISCNGVGMWCYKDAEMFSRNCFCLREYHKNLERNPLSPVDGKHWVTFTQEELTDTLDYYVEHDDERERINDAGHEYFKDALNGAWAQYYVDRLLEYTHTGDKTAFGSLLV